MKCLGCGADWIGDHKCKVLELVSRRIELDIRKVVGAGAIAPAKGGETMGFYIEVPANKGKALLIEEMYGGERIGQPCEFSHVPKGKALICVVDNGLFEAAAFCYEEKEFEEFAIPSPGDWRPRSWLLLDWDKACELAAGYREAEARRR